MRNIWASDPESAVDEEEEEGDEEVDADEEDDEEMIGLEMVRCCSISYCCGTKPSAKHTVHDADELA